MTLQRRDLNALFRASQDSQELLSALQRIPPAHRPMLLAARTLGEYLRLELPDALGRSACEAMDRHLIELVRDPQGDPTWATRACASLFGLGVCLHTGGHWIAPEGTPVFATARSGPQTVALWSPMRLVLDCVARGQGCFAQAFQDLRAFHYGHGPLPDYVFRIEPSRVPSSARVPWQWAWSLIAICGRFLDGGWDLDRSLASLGRLGELAVGGQRQPVSVRETLVAIGISSVAANPELRSAWLRRAASAYLGEVLRMHMGAQWLPHGDRSAAGLMDRAALQLPNAPQPLHPSRWIQAAAQRNAPALPTLLVRNLSAWASGAGAWPELPS